MTSNTIAAAEAMMHLVGATSGFPGGRALMENVPTGDPRVSPHCPGSGVIYISASFSRSSGGTKSKSSHALLLNFLRTSPAASLQSAVTSRQS